jgi:activator of HSP90 ATPase
MKESFEIKANFTVKASVIFHAWLNSDEHSNMTGSEAECSDQEGEEFTAWDGYITGKNIELQENKKITQSWRTVEFDESDEDSLLSIEFTETEKGCELTLTHTNIPEGQTQYEEGWIENYFIPMKAYFESE